MRVARPRPCKQARQSQPEPQRTPAIVEVESESFADSESEGGHLEQVLLENACSDSESGNRLDNDGERESPVLDLAACPSDAPQVVSPLSVPELVEEDCQQALAPSPSSTLPTSQRPASEALAAAAAATQVVILDEYEAAPLSSSKRPRSPTRVPAEDAAGPRARPKLSAAPRLGGAKLYKFPEEITVLLSPLPHCSITINANDHRWACKWKENLRFPQRVGEYSRKTFSRTFDASKEESWLGRLKVVHKHMWSKWELVSDSLPLAEAAPPQKPGQIPDGLIPLLRLEVARLPEPKNYG